MSRRPYRPGMLGEPELDELLSRTHRLHPIREIGCARGRLTVVFERPVPWPLFLRLDLAKPLAGESLKRAADRSCVRAVAIGGGKISALVR